MPKYKYTVSAVHKFTGKICDNLANFETEAQAQNFCQRMKIQSKSHENFIVLPKTTEDMNPHKEYSTHGG